MMNENEELHRMMSRVGDKLVELGFASSIIQDDATGRVFVSFTGRGMALQADMVRLARGIDLSTDEGFLEFQAIFILLTNSPK